MFESLRNSQTYLSVAFVDVVLLAFRQNAHFFAKCGAAHYTCTRVMMMLMLVTAYHPVLTSSNM